MPRIGYFRHCQTMLERRSALGIFVGVVPLAYDQVLQQPLRSVLPQQGAQRVDQFQRLAWGQRIGIDLAQPLLHR